MTFPYAVIADPRHRLPGPGRPAPGAMTRRRTRRRDPPRSPRWPRREAESYSTRSVIATRSSSRSWPDSVFQWTNPVNGTVHGRFMLWTARTVGPRRSSASTSGISRSSTGRTSSIRSRLDLCGHPRPRSPGIRGGPRVDPHAPAPASTPGQVPPGRPQAQAGTSNVVDLRLLDPTPPPTGPRRDGALFVFARGPRGSEARQGRCPLAVCPGPDEQIALRAQGPRGLVRPCFKEQSTTGRDLRFDFSCPADPGAATNHPADRTDLGELVRHRAGRDRRTRPAPSHSFAPSRKSALDPEAPRASRRSSKPESRNPNAGRRRRSSDGEG